MRISYFIKRIDFFNTILSFHFTFFLFLFILFHFILIYIIILLLLQSSKSIQLVHNIS